MFGSGWEWIIIGAALFLLFGASRLPQLAKSLGQSRKAFKEGMREAEEEEKADEEKRREIAANPAAPQISAMSDEEMAAEMRRRAEVKQS
jgi:sec-independent protein translocase protein TatA